MVSARTLVMSSNARLLRIDPDNKAVEDIDRELGSRAAAGRNNIRAMVGQTERDLLAKAGCGAKHYSHAACQIEAIPSHIVLNVSSTM